MKILVIGGTGHLGANIVEILCDQGHEVVAATRGNKGKPTHACIDKARLITLNSSDLDAVTALSEQEHFDVVVDIPGTAWNVWQAFRDKASHIVACGSLWMLGYPHVVPTPEQTQGYCPSAGYRARYEKIQEMLADSFTHKAVFTAIFPPNICGPGKIPLDTLGGRDIEVHKANMRGEVVYLPNGPEVLLGPCDAYDLATLFTLAINNRTAAAGQIFNGGSEYALTATEFVNTLAEIHGVEIPIAYVPWDEYQKKISPDVGYWWHFYAHMCPDISKARTLLGYKPRYTPQETLARAVQWMKDNELL